MQTYVHVHVMLSGYSNGHSISLSSNVILRFEGLSISELSIHPSNCSLNGYNYRGTYREMSQEIQKRNILRFGVFLDRFSETRFHIVNYTAC